MAAGCERSSLPLLIRSKLFFLIVYEYSAVAHGASRQRDVPARLLTESVDAAGLEWSENELLRRAVLRESERENEAQQGGDSGVVGGDTCLGSGFVNSPTVT